MDMMKENNCLMWSIRNGKVYKKCPQVYDLQNIIDALQHEVGELKKELDFEKTKNRHTVSLNEVLVNNAQKELDARGKLQAEIEGLKKENEALEKLRNDAWSQTRGLKTKVDDIETKVERLKGLLRYVPNGPDNVVWAEKVQQALKGDE